MFLSFFSLLKWNGLIDSIDRPRDHVKELYRSRVFPGLVGKSTLIRKMREQNP